MTRQLFYVWAIEIWIEDRSRWEPCADASLWKYDARDRLKIWREQNPMDRFRVAKYIQEKP